jgi:hypothetical protein
MQLTSETWQSLGLESFDRVLRAAGGGLRLIDGNSAGIPATGGMGLGNGESITLAAGVEYHARAWLTATATAEIVRSGV